MKVAAGTSAGTPVMVASCSAGPPPPTRLAGSAPGGHGCGNTMLGCARRADATAWDTTAERQTVWGRREGVRKGGTTTKKRRPLLTAAARARSSGGATSASCCRASAGVMPLGMGARRTTRARGGGSGMEIVVGLADGGVRRPGARLLAPEEAQAERGGVPDGARADIADMLAGGGSRQLRLAGRGPPCGPRGPAGGEREAGEKLMPRVDCGLWILQGVRTLTCWG